MDREADGGGVSSEELELEGRIVSIGKKHEYEEESQSNPHSHPPSTSARGSTAHPPPIGVSAFSIQPTQKIHSAPKVSFSSSPPLLAHKLRYKVETDQDLEPDQMDDAIRPNAKTFRHYYAQGYSTWHRLCLKAVAYREFPADLVDLERFPTWFGGRRNHVCILTLAWDLRSVRAMGRDCPRGHSPPLYRQPGGVEAIRHDNRRRVAPRDPCRTWASLRQRSEMVGCRPCSEPGLDHWHNNNTQRWSSSTSALVDQHRPNRQGTLCALTNLHNSGTSTPSTPAVFFSRRVVHLGILGASWSPGSEPGRPSLQR